MTNLPPPQREELLRRLHGCFLGVPRSGTIPGGRTEALRRLHTFDPTDYGRTRNFLDGAVSRLSPYLRHGMITTVEVREHLKATIANDSGRLAEFLRQLAWRDFFEKVLAWYGHKLEEDIESSKHGVCRSSGVPIDVVRGDTGLPCVDAMLSELFTEGYMHNHARLWFAAYLCHFRGVRWQDGAALFRQYLYDGDLASNSSSWQWVEGTFASKPYFMNKENVAKYSGNRWCATCSVKCPFDANYQTLQNRLFATTSAPIVSVTDSVVPSSALSQPTDEETELKHTLAPHTDLVWVHDASMSWDDPALKANPKAAVTFVFDRPALLKEPWAYHRLAFVLDGLDDLFTHLPNPDKVALVGDPAEQIAAVARAAGVTTIHLSDHPNPWVRETADRLGAAFRVEIHPRPMFAEYSEQPRRFSRYWKRVAPQVLGYQPGGF